MSKPQLRAVHPILPAPHIEDALEFYIDKLGFELAFRDASDPANYVGVRRDGVELHIQWQSLEGMKLSGGMQLRFLVEDPRALFEEFQEKGVFHPNTALKSTPWGTLEFAFYDLNNVGLTFYCDRVD